MANAIDLVVGDQAKVQLDALIAHLDVVAAKMTAISNMSIDLGKQVPKITTPSGGSSNSGANSSVNTELASQTALNKKLADSIALLQAKYVELTRVRGNGKKTLLEEQASVRESLRLATLEAKAVNDSVTLYQKKDAEYKKAVLAAKELGAAEGSTSQAFLKQAASVNKLGDELKAIDGKLGNHTRSVGNYASGWNGLSNSINQLTREAPAFANSMQTGFMAISNNIPILVDEINNLKKANLDLVASGGKAKSVFTTIAKSLFSWQTLISVGVTLLTMYGHKLVEMVKGLGGVEEALKSLVRQQKLMDGALDDTTRNIEAQTSVAISQAKRRGASIAEVNAIEIEGLEKIQKNLETARDSAKKEFELSKFYRTEKGKDIIKSVEQKFWEAEAEESLFRKRNKAMDTQTKKEFAVVQKKTNDAKKALDDANNLASDELLANLKSDAIKSENEVKINAQKLNVLKEGFKTSEFEDAKKLTDKNDKDVLADLYSMNRKELELQLQRIDVNLENENLSITERKAILEQDIAKRQELIELDYKEQLRLAKGDDILSKIATIEYQKSDEALMISAHKSRIELIKKHALEVYAEENRSVDSIQVAQDEIQGKRERADAINAAATVAGFKLIEAGIKKNEDASEKTKDTWKDTFNDIADQAQKAGDIISDFSDRNFENEFARLEAQKDISLKFAGESAFAKEQIEEQYDKKRREIELRQNKAKKAQAMFDIALSTASAIVQALPNIPLSVVIGALGLAQFAVVASQQIPQYFEGGTHDGGLMMVNDAKGSSYKETIVTPDGKIIKPEGRDVVMNAPKGTQIFTPEQWQEKELHNMLQSKGISMNESHHSNSGLTYQEMDAILGKHFKNITTQTTTFDKKGFSSYSVSKGNKTIRNENRASGQGFKV